MGKKNKVFGFVVDSDSATIVGTCRKHRKSFDLDVGQMVQVENSDLTMTFFVIDEINESVTLKEVLEATTDGLDYLENMKKEGMRLIYPFYIVMVRELTEDEIKEELLGEQEDKEDGDDNKTDNAAGAGSAGGAENTEVKKDESKITTQGEGREGAEDISFPPE